MRINLQHALTPKEEPDGRAGFGIGSIAGEIVIHGEALAMLLGANSSRNIHAAVHCVFPQVITHLEKLVIFGFPGQISGSRKQIHGSDRVPFRGFLLPQRKMGLVVAMPPLSPVTGFIAPLCGFKLEIVGLLSPLFHKVLG